MKKIQNTLLLVIAAAYLVGMAAFGVEAGQDKPAQKKCPVMGYPINQEQYVDHEGKRIYFCCSSCPDEFKKDPSKYMKKLED